jgi:superfamily II DNA or RNA helicase
MGPSQVRASDVEPWLADDPLVNWLDRWGEARGYAPDVGGDFDFGAFVGARATAFEEGVLRLFEARTGVTRASLEPHEDILEILKNGPKVIHRASMSGDGLSATPTLLVRSDVFAQLFSSSMSCELRWYATYDRARSIAEVASLPAPLLGQPFHYRIVQIRYAGLQLDRRGFAPGSGSLWVANLLLGQLQGWLPPFAYVLGRSVDDGQRTERSCWERLGPVPHHCDWRPGMSMRSAVDDAVAWVRRVDAEGADWQVERGTVPRELRPNLKHDVPRWKTAKQKIASAQGELTTLWQVGVAQRDRAVAGEVPDGDGGLHPAVSGVHDPQLSAAVLGVTSSTTAELLDAQLALRRAGAPAWSLGPGASDDPAWQQRAASEVYVDFETVNDLDDDASRLPWRGGQPLIFMAGVGWFDDTPTTDGTPAVARWVFRCFVVDALDVAAEGRMLDAFFACLDERRRAGGGTLRAFHWSAAEEAMLDTSFDSARSRHPGRSWPAVPWFDFLSRVVKRAPFCARGADGFGLKAIGKALHAAGLIQTAWSNASNDDGSAGPGDGLSAMVAAWRAGETARRNKQRLIDVPAMQSVVAYNEVDCRVMAEVIAFVRNAQAQQGLALATQGNHERPRAALDASTADDDTNASSTPTSPVKPGGTMKILSPAERPIDELKRGLSTAERLDAVTPALSLPAIAELVPALKTTRSARLLMPTSQLTPQALQGDEADRPWRNRLEQRVTARRFAEWLKSRAEVKPSAATQALLVTSTSTEPTLALTGTSALTTKGLGLLPSGDGFVQAFAGGSECAAHAAWFQSLWDRTTADPATKAQLLQTLVDFDAPLSPSWVYFLILQQLFGSRGDDLDEDRVVNAATGIKGTAVWQKLFRFQRDGVIGAIDKLQKYGGCIVADSVGLGKTFEALAVIKYYELRNNRVLVLCPKRLRDNWTLYKSNDQRNVLADDRFHYDVLNHTDLTRDDGFSGDIDLKNVKWGNYDLIVIDESHNFRNRPANKGRKTRYEHLMENIIKSGVKTRVLMLSATPVNNRLADLRNQIMFATENDDAALAERGIASIERTTRVAQASFNRWLDLEDEDRSSEKLIDMLGFDYFKLLDLLTIARSRKHIERYYGTDETGRFPERLKPKNIVADVDTDGVPGTRKVAGSDVEIPTRGVGSFNSVKEINHEIRRLNLSAYSPLKYVLPQKRAAYDLKYETSKDGKKLFDQIYREQSLVHLLRVNLLKRMESAVTSFKLTLERQLRDVDDMLQKLSAHEGSISFWNERDEAAIADIDVEDPGFEDVLVGNAIKVALHDIDRARWQQDLTEDRDRLARLLAAAEVVTAARDDKLLRLKQLISDKVAHPINTSSEGVGNKKVIIFSAFADTAAYLYENISTWAKASLGLETALVTGGGRNQATLPGLRSDLSSILCAFSPRSKSRPANATADGDLDILIATDCISEGQNLQDCDTLINYDIHWNPVRVIQRFGRIDRIGSRNTVIQMINFWPNMELDEYINLARRVTARMALVDVSATGEENLFAQQDKMQMNDLEYRRRQLLRLKDEVVDLEDLKSGVSISDLTLNDFRLDLSRFWADQGDVLSDAPFGVHTAVTAPVGSGIVGGVIFCLRACGASAATLAEPGYPLAPHFVVHVGDDGGIVLPYTHAKQVLERLKQLCVGKEVPDGAAVARVDKLTKNGADMSVFQRRLADAVAAVTGKSETRAVASLFSKGPTLLKKGDFAGQDDFEVVAYLVVVPAAPGAA